MTRTTCVDEREVKTSKTLAEKQKDKERKIAIEQLKIKVLKPEDNDNTFDSIIGHTRTKKYFSNLVELFSHSDEFFEENINKNFMLIGELGVGKARMTYAFAKEMNIPIVAIDMERLVNCPSIIAFEEIARIIEKNHPCVVFIKELGYVSVLEEDKSLNICTNIISLTDNFPDCFFFVTTSDRVEIFQFFITEGNFENNIVFELPDPNERELLIKTFLTSLKINYEEDLDIKRVAKDFFGLSAGDIANILKKSYLNALMEGLNKLDYKTINETLYTENFGNKQKRMSEKEMRMTAYHEAGHVIAGYYSDPEYKLSKVEIAARDESLGLTSEEVDEEKKSYTKEDFEYSIITCFGGMAAEDAIFSTTTSGVVQDLANATIYAIHYVKHCGMHKNFGPIYLDEQVFESPFLEEEADQKIHELLNYLYKKTQLIILEHKEKLIKLSEELIKKECLYKEEVEVILKND